MRMPRRSQMVTFTTSLVLFAAAGAANLIGPATPHHVALEPEGLLCAGALVVDGTSNLSQRVQALDAWELRLPLPDGSATTLRLERRNVLAPDARVEVGHANGSFAVEPPTTQIFAGAAADDADSLVVLGVQRDGGMQGLLVHGGELFSLSTGPHASGRPLVVSNLNDLPADAIEWAPFECGVDDLIDGPPPPPADETRGDRQDGWPCRIIEVAVETDWEFTADFGGDTDASAAYALLLMTAVGEIYSRDFNVSLQVPYLRVWADANDPWTAGNAGDQLGQFVQYWRDNMSDVDRHLAHFLSMRNLGGGVAYLGVVCNQWWGYGVSGNLGGYFPYPLVDHSHQNWDVFVTAHEIGHNCGAPHTHDLNPPADSCGLGDCSDAYGGTIMSYCHTCSGGMSNIALDFHPRIIDERVRGHLNGADCLQEFSTPLILTQPQPQERCAGVPAVFSVSVSSNDPLTYQWRKDGVDLPGATEATLFIDPLSVSDAGVYDVVIENGCEMVLSDGAELTVRTIAGDLNGDGLVGQTDLGLLLGHYEINDGGDIDGDGDTDQSDLGLLLANYGLSCQ